jgi:hypothetical protein
LELPANLPAKVYINGSTAFFSFGTILLYESGRQNRFISGAGPPMLLKTIAYKWHAGH